MVTGRPLLLWVKFGGQGQRLELPVCHFWLCGFVCGYICVFFVGLLWSRDVMRAPDPAMGM